MPNITNNQGNSYDPTMTSTPPAGGFAMSPSPQGATGNTQATSGGSGNSSGNAGGTQATSNQPNSTIVNYLADSSIPVATRQGVADALNKGTLNDDLAVQGITSKYGTKYGSSNPSANTSAAQPSGQQVTPSQSSQGAQQPQTYGDVMGTQIQHGLQAAGNWIGQQAPEMNKSLQQETGSNLNGPTGFLQRTGNVINQAGEGVANTIGGVVNSGLGAVSQLNPFDNRTAVQKGQQFTEGVHQAIGGVGQFLTSPLAASPVLSKGASLPFEALGAAVNYGLQKLGVDPNSDRGKAISHNLQDAATLGLIGPDHISEGITKTIDNMKSGAENLSASRTVDNPQSPEHIAAKNQKIVTNNEQNLQGIVDNNKSLRKLVDSHSAQGIDSVKLLAQTDLMNGAVSKDGTIDTGAAQAKLEKFLQPYESNIQTILKQEGKTLTPEQVTQYLTDGIENSNVTGKMRTNALNNVAGEVPGLRTDANGNIPLTEIQKAKIQAQSNSNYLDPEKSAQDKQMASSYKGLIEDNTDSVNVKNFNRDLQQHYSVLDLLDKLDGAKVKGGRLGKYFAETVGGIAGSFFGPLGTIVGAETGGLLKGNQMESTFGKTTGNTLTPTENMVNARNVAENQPNNLGNTLNRSQTTNTSKPNSINPSENITNSSIPQPPGKSNPVVDQLSPTPGGKAKEEKVFGEGVIPKTTDWAQNGSLSNFRDKHLMITTPENPMGKAATPEYNAKITGQFKDFLNKEGISYTPQQGKYGGNLENSYIIEPKSAAEQKVVDNWLQKNSPQNENIMTKDGKVVRYDPRTQEAYGVDLKDVKDLGLAHNVDDYYSKVAGKKYSFPLYSDAEKPVAAKDFTKFYNK